MTDDPSARPPLDASRLAAADLGRVEVVAEAASTNALVADRARVGEPEGLVVVAEHQTSGRGRLDRTWQTPDRAALTFSVLLRPKAAPAAWPWLPLLAGYAVGRALEEVGLRAGLKWPNDVLLDDLKVAGILTELVETPDGPAAVVGIGLNVSTTAEELPVDTATSLALAGATGLDRTDLLATLLRTLHTEYAAWQAGNGAELRAAYTRACVSLGRQVRVDLPSGEVLSGTAVGIDPDGRLRVRTGTGEVSVGAGDVVHARATGEA
ncbi:biotin--[acetyl-CoA-carboxylase] ligase [Nocardioides sp.]|uniref:biotin--[acetyl-CoA-carboxylase] ligase n=1 Tax=Nocardioides sp. TaxID=35761 RepID=UPI00356800A7